MTAPAPPAPGGDIVLTDNFTLSEFTCKCGCGLEPDIEDPHFIELVQTLQSLRDRANEYEDRDKPLVVSSGIRCREHNREVRGARNSFHLVGWAADVYMPGVPTEKLYRIALTQLDFSGLIIYPEKHSIHVDVGDRLMLGETRGESRTTIMLGSRAAIGLTVALWMFLAGI